MKKNFSDSAMLALLDSTRGLYFLVYGLYLMFLLMIHTLYLLIFFIIVFVQVVVSVWVSAI